VLDALYAQYPSLRESTHNITSLPTDEYNCVAWVSRELNRWYEPGICWPAGVPEPVDAASDLESYVALFEHWGYERCCDGSYEDGFLKVALYADGQSFQHVAKQLRDGTWSSKAGTLHDLRHASLDALWPCGLLRNARPAAFMRRLDDGATSQAVEMTGLILD
jgi:hypothetical protein